MKYKKLENQKKILMEYENSSYLITYSAVQLKYELYFNISFYLSI